MVNQKDMLLKTLTDRQAHVAVIGLGYVGLPLAVAFARVGYRVSGIDLDPRKVDAVNRGHSYVEDIPSTVLQPLVSIATEPTSMSAADNRSGGGFQAGERGGQLTATTDFSVLATCDAVSICVPTPLNKTDDPDMSYVRNATEQVAKYLHPGMVIVLESTSYPGTTNELILGRLQEVSPDLAVGQDYFLAFSPERIDPGRTDWTVETMPKVIGGVTASCREVATAFYGPAVGPLVPVSSPEAAEMVKLFENTFRAVNIALANELLLMCDKLGLDAWEILEAAATKPFGFMKFTPGPGLGGHCIPVDPHYLSWKLRTLEYNARFISLASEINTEMPRYWVQKIQDALNDGGKALKGSRILVLGIAYKRNVSDLRESPALDIIHLLREKGALVEYHDPYVESFAHDGMVMASVNDFLVAVRQADCVLIATDHDSYNWKEIASTAHLIVDTRHVLDSANSSESE